LIAIQDIEQYVKFADSQVVKSVLTKDNPVPNHLHM